MDLQIPTICASTKNRLSSNLPLDKWRMDEVQMSVIWSSRSEVSFSENHLVLQVFFFQTYVCLNGARIKFNPEFVFNSFVVVKKLTSLIETVEPERIIKLFRCQE